jgi:hypothetical protein
MSMPLSADGARSSDSTPFLAVDHLHQKRALKSAATLVSMMLMGDVAGVVFNAKSTRQSIMAFLDGEQTLDWILSVIDCGGDLDALHQFVRDLKGYGDPERRDQLLRRLEAA